MLSTIALISVAAPVAGPHYRTQAPIAYLVDLSSGAILLDKASSKPIPPASMTKMMTAYVIFDLIERGTLTLEQKFVVRPSTWKNWNNNGSTMYLKPGEQVSLDHLLQGLLTLSGNDAAVVLAEGVAGSEAAFVRRMNAVAKTIGMTRSTFGTATGWPDGRRTVTSAHDLALLGERTIKDFPTLYRKYYARRDLRWNNIAQRNRNPILDRVAGADGMKTGHTSKAGYCLAGAAERDGRRLLMVIAGLPTMAARTDESVRLLNWGFTAWRAQPLYRAGSVVATLPVQLGNQSRIRVIAPRPLALTLPASDAPRYKLLVRYSGPVKAPFKKGTPLAQLVAKFDDGHEVLMPLVADQSVSQTDFFGRVRNGARRLVGQ